MEIDNSKVGQYINDYNVKEEVYRQIALDLSVQLYKTGIKKADGTPLVLKSVSEIIEQAKILEKYLVKGE